MVDKKEILSEWADLYLKEMIRWAIRRVRDGELARDLVQDSFLAAYEQMDKFQGKSSPKTWLFAILKYKIAVHFQKNEAQSTFDSSSFFDERQSWRMEQLPHAFYAEASEELLDNPIFNEVLEKCMNNLSRLWNVAIVSKYLEQKDASTICQELGISDTNYWQMIHRAKLQLRRCLEINWFTK